MFVSVVLFLILIGFPVSAVALFDSKGDRVEVAIGTQLCANVRLQEAKGVPDPIRVFWRVTSNLRSNGTQAVSAFIQEQVYDNKSGDTRIKETVFQENYARFFKRDPEHKGMLLMISPKDGSIEALVGPCEKQK